jgi:hypothetical protein
MTTAKSLPPRPSLESLRKQAKALARGIAAGDATAIARAHAQLPQAKLPLSQRDAQLVLAREYGFRGWKDLLRELQQRLGTGLEWAVSEARRTIHDNDVERLRQLLVEYPALLSWKAHKNDGGLLALATGSYGDSGDTFREGHFTRLACAELLLDAGAVVAPSVSDGIIASRARGLIDLFHRRGLFPRTLKFLAAFGDIEVVRTVLEQNGTDLATVTEAFTIACDFKHEAVASLLLDRVIELDPEFGTRMDGTVGRPAFIEYFIDKRPGRATEVGPWKAFVMEQVRRAVCSWSGHSTSVTPPVGDSDLPAFLRLLRGEPWLLGEASVDFQAEIIETAIRKDRGNFITTLLDLDPAILRRQPPP